MLIHKDALQVADVVQKEESRYFLSGALFDKQGRAVATDGHVLIRFTCDPLPVEQFPKIHGVDDVTPAADVIVALGDLKAARATMAKQSNLRSLDYFALIPNGEMTTIVATDLNHQVTIRTKKIDGTYPNYQKILDDCGKRPVVFKLALSAEYLALLGRIVKNLGGESVVLTISGNTDPVAIEAKVAHGSVDGALMPMRL